jgi:hypothetical protein
MKPLVATLLAASLALNAALAGLILAGYPASRPAPAPAAAAPRAAPPAPVAIDATVWPALAAGELPALVARLRAAGFPPDAVRAILTAQVRERFAARRQALDPGADGRPFWFDPAPDARTQSALRQIAREERAALRELLGADAESADPMRDLYQHRSLTFLSPEKAVDVRQILRDFEERRADLYASGFNATTDRAKLTALDKEQLAAIAATLTPAEFEDYKLRAGPTATALREQLAAFNPTEAEFRALHQWREAFDERFGPGSGLALDREASRQRSEAEKAINDQFKATLTPERAADYDRALDYNYRRASQLFARLELPAANLAQVWQVQKDFEQQRMTLLRQPPTADRPAQLAALQAEAAAKVAPLIGGARNLDAYRQYGGNWLQPIQITRAPAPAATPAAKP